MNLFIGNLDYKVTEEELKAFFEQSGEVSSAKIIINKYNGRSKGYGFVEMPNDAEAESAVANLNGKPLKEREISVAPARPKTEGDNRPE